MKKPSKRGTERLKKISGLSHCSAGRKAGPREPENFYPVTALDMPVQHQSQTLRQLGFAQPNRMLALHEILDKICITVASKHMAA